MEVSRVLFLIDITNEENKVKSQEIKNKIVEKELKYKMVFFDTIKTESIGMAKLDHISTLYNKIKDSDIIYYIADYEIEKYYQDRPFASLINYSNELNKKNIQFFI
jgi:ribosomal protein S4E